MRQCTWVNVERIKQWMKVQWWEAVVEAIPAAPTPGGADGGQTLPLLAL